MISHFFHVIVGNMVNMLTLDILMTTKKMMGMQLVGD
jgi:hypothetical protein